jgi:hypothetical protein
MPSSASGPGLNTFMDAYAVIGVQPAATPLAIRKAYKREVRRASSERLRSIESAYRLICEAPLRHHRVSTGVEPDTPWTDDELEFAWRRAQIENVMSYGLGIALGTLTIGLYSWLVLPRLWSTSPVAAPLVAIVMVGALTLFVRSRVPSSVHLWRAIEIYRRLVGSHASH